jgi:hypothetical protein
MMLAMNGDDRGGLSGSTLRMPIITCGRKSQKGQEV